MKSIVRWFAGLGIIALLSFTSFVSATAAEEENPGLEGYFINQFEEAMVSYPCTSVVEQQEVFFEDSEIKNQPLALTYNGAKWARISLQIEEGGDFAIPIEIEILKAEDDQSTVAVLNEKNDYTSPYLALDDNYAWRWKTASTSTTEGATMEASDTAEASDTTEGLPLEVEQAPTAQIVLNIEYNFLNVTQTCFIGPQAEVTEGNKELFVQSFEAGTSMIIMDNPDILEFFNVEVYEDTLPEDQKMFSGQTSGMYIKDNIEFANQFGCARNPLSYLAVQWLCMRDSIFQTLTFLSGDFFMLFSGDQQIILEQIKKPGWVGLEYEEPPTEIEGKDTVAFLRGVFWWIVFSVTLVWALSFFKRFLEWIKSHTHKLRRYAFGGLLTSVVLVAGLYMTGVNWIPVKVFEGYLGLYVLASICLLYYRKEEIQKFIERFIPQRFKGPEARGKEGNLVMQITLLSGILWLYSFFLWPEVQWIPFLSGVLSFGIAIFLLPRQTTPSEKFWDHSMILALKALPFIVLSIAVGQGLMGQRQIFEWDVTQWTAEQTIRLETTGGASLEALYVPMKEAILIDGSVVVTAKGLDKNVNKDSEVKISLWLESPEAMTITGAGIVKNALIYIPDHDRWSLIRKDEEGVGLYRTQSVRVLSPAADSSIEDLLESELRKDDLLMDLREGQHFSALVKSSFETSFAPTTTFSEWPLSLQGGGEIEFYVETFEDTLFIDIDLAHQENQAVGVEFLNMSLLDANERVLDFKTEEINYADFSKNISWQKEDLSPGIYIVRLEKISGNEHYLNSEKPFGYTLEKIKVNSPVIMLSASEFSVTQATSLAVFPTTETWLTELTEEGELSKTLLRPELQVVDLGDTGGKFSTSSPLLVASSLDRWVSPFEYLLTDHWSNLADYLLIESHFFDQIIQAESGEFIFTKTFTLSAGEEPKWILDFYNSEAGKTPWFLKKVTLQIL